MPIFVLFFWFTIDSLGLQYFPSLTFDRASDPASQFVYGGFRSYFSSIQVTSLEGKKKASLEKHLRSDDFFGIEEFPTAEMVISAVESTTDGYNVTGDFTIKGQTHPVTFPMVVNGNTATAKVKIDRTKYNVRYGSDTFFDNLGNRVIYNEFDLNVKLTF